MPWIRPAAAIASSQVAIDLPFPYLVELQVLGEALQGLGAILETVAQACLDLLKPGEHGSFCLGQ